MDRLNDPAVVRREYATEDGLLARASIYDGSHGEDANDVLVAMVLEQEPSAVLEVGCGPGLLAQALADASGVRVTAIDISERMVELARSRGVDAQVADVQTLPFDDASFDAVIAAWMLYHVPDLSRGLSEISRVLRPGGKLFAVTNGDGHLAELWDLIGLGRYSLGFSSENGAELLAEHFDQIDRRDVTGTVTFADEQAVRRYVASTIKARHLVDNVPPLSGSFSARRRNTVLAATK
jgi:SAM-dependent methyltransferase